MKTTLQTLLAICAMALSWQVGRTAPAPKPAARPPAQVRTVPSDGRFLGLAIQLHGGPRVFEDYQSLIPEIAELGADTILFVVHGWQTHAGTLDLHLDAQKTADAAGLGKLLDLAAAHGMRRILMPVTLLKEPRNGEWRGKIIPPGHDWDAWFKRYRRFVVHFAKVAERHKVELLMVGSELIKSEGYTQHWRDTIAEVRQNYRGKVSYSSNWDHYQTSKIGFWDDLDFIGMTTYYELAKKPNPSIEEIDANWARIKTEILAFQKEVGKPIVFTEVGWCSQEGAAHEGWNYYASEKATEAGHREQAILYESFLRNWADEPSVGGMIWWEWTPGEGGKSDYGYTPKRKVAETFLRRLFADKPSTQPADRSQAAERLTE